MTSRSLRAGCATLALFAALAAPVHGATAKPHARKKKIPPPPELTLTGSLTGTPGAIVAMPPVGISLEYPAMAADLGAGECPPPALTAELQRLGSPPLQLAGQSQDFTVPAATAPAPPQSWEELTLYPLPAEFWTRLHCLLTATREPLTAGLNLRIGRLPWAEQIVAGATGAATNGVSFSLGNEPDLYYLPNYSSLDKEQANEEAAEVGLYLRAAAALRPAVGANTLIGPELSGPAHWRSELPGVISTLGLGAVGVHVYPLSVCRTPRAATVNGLLEPSVGDAPSRLAWVVGDARAAGRPAVITEANSVSCGGKSGVSDSSASAVWAVRFVLSALRTGFAEVRFHFSGDPYDPFYVRGAEVVRRPIEAAMTALNQWLPVGSTLRSIAGLRGLAATAIAAPGTQPLVLIDNGERKTRTLLLKGETPVPAGAFGPGRALPTLRLAKGGGRLVTLPANTILALRY